jgi:ATP-dependent helicase/nuclease subunit A
MCRSPNRAFKRGKCRRETPITLRADDGSLVEGIVDLAFEENETWYVVDFKTDAELQDRLDSYRRQVSVYATAVSAATGFQTSAILMRI